MKFYVSVPVVATHVYEVNATDEQDAKRKISLGYGKLIDEDSNTVADPDEDTWEVTQ